MHFIYNNQELRTITILTGVVAFAGQRDRVTGRIDLSHSWQESLTVDADPTRANSGLMQASEKGNTQYVAKKGSDQLCSLQKRFDGTIPV